MSSTRKFKQTASSCGLVFIAICVFALMLLQGYVSYWASLDPTHSIEKTLWSSIGGCPTVESSPSTASQQVVPSYIHMSPMTATGVRENATCDDVMNHFHRIQQSYLDEEKDSSPPLINYGLYVGQGFGRLIDHTAMHCILAFSIGRSCLIDLSDRDQYFTWRAFIHTGSLDWEIEKPRFKELAASVADAIQKLPQRGAGEWDAPVPHTDSLHLAEKLEWSARSTRSVDYWKNIAPWRPEKLPKPFLSPNWGLSWFPKLRFPNSFGLCSFQELHSRVQNAMYEPAALARKLFEEKRAELMGKQPRPFGSIHIRYVILGFEKKTRNDEHLLKPLLQNCLQYAKEKTGLRHWWLISDKPAKIASIARNVSSTKEMAKDFNLYYDVKSSNQTDFAAHSNSKESRGMFGHAHMASSVVDWMILHESKASLVTQGSFARTGASGHDKYARATPQPCGQFFTLFS